MERLTERTESGRVYLVSEPETDIYGNLTEKGFEQLDKIYERLAAYEDTGLAPDEIPHWIPCSERLPEEAYGCLLIVEEDDYFNEPQKVLLPYFAGYDGTQWNDGDGQQIPFEVIYWQSLPQPPKEEK